MEGICFELTHYVHLKDNHMFFTVEELKAFLTILLVSWYAELPRQKMYWEIQKDCHNLVVSAMMTKTDFLEGKPYLHLADNTALNSSYKFAKVRPLFNTINEQCIFNYQLIQYVSVDDTMVLYFEEHGGKEYIHGSLGLDYGLWELHQGIASNISLKLARIQFCRSMKTGIGLGASVIPNLVSKLCVMQTSNYKIVMDN